MNCVPTIFIRVGVPEAHEHLCKLRRRNGFHPAARASASLLCEEIQIYFHSPLRLLLTIAFPTKLTNKLRFKRILSVEP